MKDQLREFILSHMSHFHLRKWHEPEADGYTYIHKSLTLEIFYRPDKCFLDFAYMPHDCDKRVIVSICCDNSTSDTIIMPYMDMLDWHLKEFLTELKNII